MGGKAYVGNAADPKQVKAADKKEKEQDRQEGEDIKSVLSTPAGRRFIWRYLGICGIFQSSYTGESAETFFNEGKRNVGLALLNDVTGVSPEAYLQMMQEAQEEPEDKKPAETEEPEGG